MEIDAKYKGDQLTTYSRAFFEIIDNDIWGSENYTEEPLKFYYTMAYKLHSLLDTASLLVYNVDDKPHFIHTLYLSLRTCMLDVICLYYVLDAHEKPQLAKERVEKIMADHIRVFYNAADNERDRKMIQEKCPQFFKDGTLIHDKGVSTKFMIKNISHFPSLKEEVRNAEVLYDILSKFEHNGYFTYDLLHGTHVNETKEKAKGYIIDAIGVAMIAANTVILNWIGKDNVRYHKVVELTKLFLNQHAR